MAGTCQHSQANDAYSRSLTCVRAVYQNGPEILRLSHIVDKLDEYLDGSRKWTLPNACASDSPYLVERIIANQKAEAPTSFLHRPNYRQWQFNCSLYKAVDVGNLEIVQQLAKHFGGCRVSWHVVENAAKRGLSEILKWMDGCGCKIDWCAGAVSEAIRNGFFELANWLQEKLPGTSVAYLCLVRTLWAGLAAEKGDLTMVKQICGSFMERASNGILWYSGVDLWGIVQRATNYGHLHVLKWVMDEPNRKVFLYELSELDFDAPSGIYIHLYHAAARGHVDVLTWFIENYPELCNISDADYYAAKNGHLDILRVFLSAPIEKKINTKSIPVAAGNGYLDIVKLLLAEGYPVNKAMDKAAANGFLDIVKWLHENTSHSCSTKAMDGAAGNGHLNIVKWLHYNRNEGCTTNAMNDAAGHGHVSVVQWLHEHRTEGCTRKAMDYAAEMGHLNVVKWLHFNTRKGCTAHAMENAAGNGHLDVVKWLHLNRLEGCTYLAVDYAARFNQLPVLKWLYQTRMEGFTPGVMRVAVSIGNLEMIQWLLSRRPELYVASLMSVAAASRHFDVLWFLHHNHNEASSIESLKKALHNEPSSRMEFAEWAYAHHRHEFELNIAEHLVAD